MYKGTTPDIVITLPEEIDLSLANNVYVSISKSRGKELIRKGTSDLIIDRNTISLSLSQQETLGLPDVVELQANWTYTDIGGAVKRAATDKARFYIKPNSINQVLI